MTGLSCGVLADYRRVVWLTACLGGGWDGQTLRVEDFAYNDSEIDQITWQLKEISEGQFTGTREGVAGEEKRGRRKLTALRLLSATNAGADRLSGA